MKKGYFYFVPIVFNPENGDIKGRGFVSDLLLDIMINIHHLFVFTASFLIKAEWSFPIRIVE